jgi:hypothetical protein
MVSIAESTEAHLEGFPQGVEIIFDELCLVDLLDGSIFTNLKKPQQRIALIKPAILVAT